MKMKVSMTAVLMLLTAFGVAACGAEEEPAERAADQAEEARENSREELENAAADEPVETVGDFEDERAQARDSQSDANMGSSGSAASSSGAMQQAERAQQLNNPESNTGSGVQ